MIASEILDLDVFYGADCSQVEVRCMAELSGDPLLIRQFQEAAAERNNPLKDVHCQVGHMMTGWPIERIFKDKKTRKVCKNVHFGICYGLGEESVYPYVVAKIRATDGPQADLTGITPVRMKQLWRKYFQVYKGVARYQENQRNLAEKQGYVETLFGFRREIRSNDSRSTYTGNQAINSPVQGTAHTYMLIALALLDLKPRTYCHLQSCLMEVHDALFFRVKLRNLVEAHKQFMELLEHDVFEYAQKRFQLKLRVPILAEGAAGFTMSSMIDYSGEPLNTFLPKWREKQHEIDAKSWEDLMPTVMV